MTIQSNVAALMTARYLSYAQADLTRSLERLSSGLRISRASDDAAGLAISTGLRARIGGVQVALRNAQDAISVTQVADGALASTQDVLHHMRDLVVQVANTGAGNPTSGAAISAELHTLSDTLDHIARTTTSNGTNLLTGTYKGVFQVGADAGDTLSMTALDASAKGLGLATMAPTASLTGVTATPGKADFGGHPGTASTFHIDLADDAAVTSWVASLPDPATSFTVNGTSVDVTGVNTLTALATAVATTGGVSATADSTGVLLTATTNGTTPITVTGATGTSTPGTADVPNAGGSPATFTALVDLDNPGGSISFTGGAPLDLASLAPDLAAAATATGKAYALQTALADAFTGVNVAVAGDGTLTMAATTNSDATFTVQASGADVALDALDNAIGLVSQARGTLGASANRFGDVIAIASSGVANLSAASSRITDTDMASEVVELSRASIVSQAAIAMLAQATAQPRSVLALLQR